MVTFVLWFPFSCVVLYISVSPTYHPPPHTHTLHHSTHRFYKLLLELLLHCWKRKWHLIFAADLLTRLTELFHPAQFLELLPADGNLYFLIPFLASSLETEHTDQLKRKIVHMGKELMSQVWCHTVVPYLDMNNQQYEQVINLVIIVHF